MVTLGPGSILAAGTCHLSATTYSGLHRLQMLSPDGAVVASTSGGCNATSDGGVYLTYMLPFVRRRSLLASSTTTYMLFLSCAANSPACTGSGAYTVTQAAAPPSPPPSPPLVPGTVTFSLCIAGYSASDFTVSAASPNTTTALAIAGITSWLASFNCTLATVTVSNPSAGCSSSQVVLAVTVAVLVETTTADGNAAAILAIRALGASASAPAALLAALQGAGLALVSSAVLPLVVGSGALSVLVTAQVTATLAATTLPPPAVRLSTQAGDAPPPPPSWPPALSAPPDANGGAGGAVNRHYSADLSPAETVAAVTSGVTASLTGLAALCIVGWAYVQAKVGAHLRRTAVTAALLVQGHIFEESMAACKKSASGRLRTSRTGEHLDAPLGKTCEAPAAADAITEVLRSAAELFGSIQGVRPPKKVALRPLLKNAIPVLDVPTNTAKKAPPSKKAHLFRRLYLRVAAELRWQRRETRAALHGIGRWIYHRGAPPGAGHVMTLMPVDTPVVVAAATDGDHPSAGLAARMLQPGGAPTCVLVQVTWYFGHGAGGQDAASVWRSHLRDGTGLAELEASVSASLRAMADATELSDVGTVVLSLLDDEPHMQLDKARGQELQGRLASTVGARLDAIAAEQGPEGTDPLRVVFNSFDDDGSGCLDAEELQSALGLLGVSLPLAEAEHLVTQLDTDGNGDVSFGEFEAWWASTTTSSVASMAEVVSGRLEALETEAGGDGTDAITRVFDSLDTDGSGSLDAEELRTALSQLGVPMSPREAHNLMATLDADGSGSISLEEFNTWWSATLEASVNAVRNFGVSLAVAQRLLLMRLVGGADDAWKVHSTVTHITSAVAVRCHTKDTATGDDATDGALFTDGGRSGGGSAERRGALHALSRRFRVLGEPFCDPGLAQELSSVAGLAATVALGVAPTVHIRALQRETLLGAHGGMLLSDDQLVAAMLQDAKDVRARRLRRALEALATTLRRLVHSLRRLVTCTPPGSMTDALVFRRVDASQWPANSSHAPTTAAVCELQWRFSRRQQAAGATWLEYLHSEVGVADLERRMSLALQAAGTQAFSCISQPGDVVVALLDTHLLSKADAADDAVKSLRGGDATERAVRISLTHRRLGAQARRLALLQQLCIQNKAATAIPWALGGGSDSDNALEPVTDFARKEGD